MSLVDTLKAASVKARLERNTVSSNLLTTLYSEVVMVGKNKGNRETTDAEAIAVIKKFRDGIQDTLGFADRVPSLDVEVLKAELDIVNGFLPKQLSPDELKVIVAKMIESSDSITMGLVMNQLRKEYGGMYEGDIASKIVKDLIQCHP